MWAKPQLIAATVLFCLAAMAAYADSGEAPGEELLEFLGEFQTQDGEWFDPMNLLTVNQSDISPRDSRQGEINQTDVKRDNEEQSDE